MPRAFLVPTPKVVCLALPQNAACLDLARGGWTRTLMWRRLRCRAHFEVGAQRQTFPRLCLHGACGACPSFDKAGAGEVERNSPASTLGSERPSSDGRLPERLPRTDPLSVPSPEKGRLCRPLRTAYPRSQLSGVSRPICLWLSDEPEAKLLRCRGNSRIYGRRLCGAIPAGALARSQKASQRCRAESMWR